jgi:hypothetical protein
VDPNEIEARLRSALERHEDVIVAYLFGSTDAHVGGSA